MIKLSKFFLQSVHHVLTAQRAQQCECNVLVVVIAYLLRRRAGRRTRTDNNYQSRAIKRRHRARYAVMMRQRTSGGWSMEDLEIRVACQICCKHIYNVGLFLVVIYLLLIKESFFFNFNSYLHYRPMVRIFFISTFLTYISIFIQYRYINMLLFCMFE